MIKKFRWFLCPLFIIAGIASIYFGFNAVVMQMNLEYVGEAFSKSQVIINTILIIAGFSVFWIGAVAIPDKTFDEN